MEEMTINYSSLAEEATKLDIWVKAPGGNRYVDLSALDPPHEGLLVNVGSRRYTIIDEEDLSLLSWRKYRINGRYVSSRDTYLHREVMLRRLSLEDKATAEHFHVIHRCGDPLDNRRSNLRWVDGRFELDRETGLPPDIKKQGRKYRVRITFDGETRSRTFKKREDAMAWWYDTKMEMMSNDPHISTLNRLNGVNNE